MKTNAVNVTKRQKAIDVKMKSVSLASLSSSERWFHNVLAIIVDEVVKSDERLDSRFDGIDD